MASLLLGLVQTSRAELVTTVDKMDQVGGKAVLKLTLKNTFTEKVDSARAQVFLLDESGKMVGQATRWVIGGQTKPAEDKKKTGLAPGASTVFNFVIAADKPFTKARVGFSRIVLEGGKVVTQSTVAEAQK